jgi:hypothetical protein
MIRGKKRKVKNPDTVLFVQASMTCSSCPWFCWLPFRSPEEGIILMQNVKFLGYQAGSHMQIPYLAED